MTILKVLFLCSRMPLPAVSGGQVLMAGLLRGLHHEVTVAVLSAQYEEDVSQPEAMAALPAVKTVIFPALRPSQQAMHDHRPWRIRTHQSADYQEAVARLLRDEHYDLIHVQSYFLAPYVPKGIGVPIVIFEENIEYELDRLLRDAAVPGFEHEDWNANREYVHSQWRRASKLLVLTARDAAIMHRDYPEGDVAVLTMGWDHIRSRRRSAHRTGKTSLTAGNLHRQAVFVGNYSWAPTFSAAGRLVEVIWPRIKQILPHAVLQLVGAGLPWKVRHAWSEYPGVRVIGQVPDATEWVDERSVLIAPLSVSSGVSVKVLEALQLGAHVVTTPAVATCLPRDWQAQVSQAITDQEFAYAASAALTTAEISQRGNLPVPTWADACAQLNNCWVETAHRNHGGLV